MARYTGADCRRCRREKMKLFLKGSKCESPKCPIEIRPYPPGEHGRGRTKDSEYLLQKREKQKCARIYGVLEKQFRGYYEEAVRHGHVLVNGKKVDIPSYRVTPNDIVEIRPKSRELTPYVIARETAGDRGTPPWMEVISSQMRVLIHNLPARQVIDTPVQEQLIVELYSK